MFKELTILGGVDKYGAPEAVREFSIIRGQIYSIVGFTGSGKSQLIRDIEQIAQGDTVSKREMLLDGRKPDAMLRFNPEKKVVAHLSQNMNFVLDMQVGEFLIMHAECRGVASPAKNVLETLACANTFAGEPIGREDSLTRLSGGQSRALMLADVAINGNSPIVLVDELENAGIDRIAAMDVLAERHKMVLVVTHDPLLALLAEKRVIMKNGGMRKVMHTTAKEKEVFGMLQGMSDIISGIQQELRMGNEIDRATDNGERLKEMGGYRLAK